MDVFIGEKSRAALIAVESSIYGVVNDLKYVISCVCVLVAAVSATMTKSTEPIR